MKIITFEFNEVQHSIGVIKRHFCLLLYHNCSKVLVLVLLCTVNKSSWFFFLGKRCIESILKKTKLFFLLCSLYYCVNSAIAILFTEPANTNELCTVLKRISNTIFFCLYLQSIYSAIKKYLFVLHFVQFSYNLLYSSDYLRYLIY